MYLERLGLWSGHSSSLFKDFASFYDSVEKGGVGMMELTATHLKSSGSFLCRTLSFEHCTFEVVEEILDKRKTAIYDTAAVLWQELWSHFHKRYDAGTMAPKWRISDECDDNFPTACMFDNDDDDDDLNPYGMMLPENFRGVNEYGYRNKQYYKTFFWGAHQRFFRGLLMALKSERLISLAKEALSQGNCVVIGLQTTGEAESSRDNQTIARDDLISAPSLLAQRFIRNIFPIPAIALKDYENVYVNYRVNMESAILIAMIKNRLDKNLSDGHSNIHTSHHYDYDDDDDSFASDKWNNHIDVNNTVINVKTKKIYIKGKKTLSDVLIERIYQRILEYLITSTTPLHLLIDIQYLEAYQGRYKYMKLIQDLNLPGNALDEIVNSLGGPTEVAELSGRKTHLVKQKNGKYMYQKRCQGESSQARKNLHEKKRFMDGDKLVAIVSDAASAGISLHADKCEKNKRRRVHITLELPWASDKAIQQLGRSHRSNQTSAPEYKLLFTDLAGEKRFASIVAKRLESLGALTQGKCLILYS
tara:strand:+ start:2171 stop:3766 length:1596 start_codon:yes stop_codon:yes gene_type:complete